MKIAAVVILYQPCETAIINIKTYYQHVQKIYVVDNTETKSEIQSTLSKLPNVELYHDNKNQGIAARLNTICKRAIQNGFDWLLTMDQDTSFDDKDITDYFKCFNEYKPKATVALFGPEFKKVTKKKSTGCTAKETEKLITSGALLNLSLFKQIGGFDEALFIDSVDFDYCFRAKIKGFSLIQFPHIYILHCIGKQVYCASIKTLFLYKKNKEIHSPLRCYYMYRNMLYLKQKYCNEDPVFFKQIKGYVLSKIKVCLLYGGNTLQTIKYLKAAKKDYENNKMGKIEQEL